MIFTIPVKPISWNALINKHYRTHIRLKQEWKEHTKIALAYIKTPFKSPVKIVVWCSWKTHRRHDIDAIFFKPVLDAIVELGLLPDDNLGCVHSVTLTGAVGMLRDEMIITIESV